MELCTLCVMIDLNVPQDTSKHWPPGCAFVSLVVVIFCYRLGEPKKKKKEGSEIQAVSLVRVKHRTQWWNSCAQYLTDFGAIHSVTQFKAYTSSSWFILNSCAHCLHFLFSPSWEDTWINAVWKLKMGSMMHISLTVLCLLMRAENITLASRNVRQTSQFYVIFWYWRLTHHLWCHQKLFLFLFSPSDIQVLIGKLSFWYVFF